MIAKTEQGTSRGGCTSKVHAVIDRKGRPLRFLLSGGQCFDGKAAVPLPRQGNCWPTRLTIVPRSATGCRGTTPVIPNKINRRKPYPHNK
jgi:hypothetical protein